MQYNKMFLFGLMIISETLLIHTAEKNYGLAPYNGNGEDYACAHDIDYMNVFGNKAEVRHWSEIVDYGEDNNGVDTFEYDMECLIAFADSVQICIKNQTLESLRTVRKWQKSLFPFTKPLRQDEVPLLEKELSVFYIGGQIAEDGFLNKRLLNPSEEKIKKRKLYWKKETQRLSGLDTQH